MLRRVLRWLAISLFMLLVVLPAVFAAVFLSIQYATERQWLGRAPQHAAIDVRLRQPHPVALLDVGFDSLAARLKLIEAAQRSIELEFFIYELDESARLITQALARKAAQGVRVRILVDFAKPVFRLAPEDTQALAALANRAMRLQCLIQDGEMLITGEGESIRIEPEVVFGKP